MSVKEYFFLPSKKIFQKYIMIPIDFVFLRKLHSENYWRWIVQETVLQQSVLAVRSHSYWDDSVSAQMQSNGGDSLLWMIYGCLLLKPPPGNFIGEDLRLFPGFREGWIFTAIIKNKFWAFDCLYSYLVSKVKRFSENNNTMLAKTSVCDKQLRVFSYFR